MLEDGRWTDSRTEARDAAKTHRVKVRPFSPAYFALLQAIPELRDAFALGDRVLVYGRTVAIETAPDGVEQLGDAEVAAAARAW